MLVSYAYLKLLAQTWLSSQSRDVEDGRDSFVIMGKYQYPVVKTLPLAYNYRCTAFSGTPCMSMGKYTQDLELNKFIITSAESRKL